MHVGAAVTDAEGGAAVVDFLQYESLAKYDAIRFLLYDALVRGDAKGNSPA